MDRLPRLATETDVEALLDLARSLYAEDGDVPFRRAVHRGAVEELIAHPEAGLAYVVEAGGEVAAYTVVAWGFSLEHGGRSAVLDELYVAPQHRRQGLARRLVAAVEAACRERAVRAIHLEVERANLPAQDLYRRLGFREQDRHLMTKPLEG